MTGITLGSTNFLLFILCWAGMLSTLLPWWLRLIKCADQLANPDHDSLTLCFEWEEPERKGIQISTEHLHILGGAVTGHYTGQCVIHLLAWWWCQSSPWTNSLAWQRRVEDLQSCNCSTETFVRSWPRCVSITVHLLITSNPRIWQSIVGYSTNDLQILLLIPAVKQLWELISILDLTSRVTGFKSK